MKRIRGHRQYNVIIAKFKHENLGEKTRTIEKRKKQHVDTSKQLLPPSEIYGAINKAHLVLGDQITDKRKAMPLIFRLVKEEAEKHGYRTPSAHVVYRYYQEYLRRNRLLTVSY